MSTFGFDQIKTALSQALEGLSDWSSLNRFDKGKVIDKTFKSLMRDLMKQFGMQPGVDYVDNLSDNARSADFVALSQQADELIRGLLDGKIIAISGHIAILNDFLYISILMNFGKIKFMFLSKKLEQKFDNLKRPA